MATNSFGDEIVGDKPSSGATNTFGDPIIEGSGPSTSATKAFATHAAMGSAPAVGGVAGAGTLMVVGAPLAAATGPAAPLTELALAITGAFGGAAIISKLQDAVTSTPGAQKLLKPWGMDKESMAKQEEEHPYASFAGGLAPNIAMFKPGKLTLPQRAGAVGLGSGIEAGQEAVNKETLDPAKIAMAGAVQGAFPEPRGGVAKLFPSHASTEPVKRDGGPPVQPEHEEIMAKENEFIDGIERKVNREKELKGKSLDQAAFKDPKTGEVTPQGSAHDDSIKKTRPDLVQGFLTKDGEFVDRHEGAFIAKEAHADKLQKEIDPKVGLHSSDFGPDRMNALKPKSAAEQLGIRTDSRVNFHEDLEKEDQRALKLEAMIEEKARRGAPEEELKALNKDLDEHVKLLEEAHKEGGPKWEKPFADVNHEAPSVRDVHEALAGAKTVGEGLDRIVKLGFGNKAEQQLAKFLSKNTWAREATLTRRSNVGRGLVNDKVELLNGQYDPGPHHVDLYGPGGLDTFIHEAIHAATFKALDDASGKAAFQLNKIFEAIKERAITNKDDFHYGFTNVHEMVTEAFTNPDFQRVLAKYTVKDTAVSMWESFKNAVKEALGINDKVIATALDSVLDRGAKIIEEGTPPGMRGEENPDGGKPLPSIVKPELAGSPISDDSRLNPSEIKNEADFQAKAKELMATKGKEAVRDFYRQWEAQKQGFRDHVKEAEELIHDNLKNKEALLRLVDNIHKDFKALVPDQARREAVAEAVDKGESHKLSGAEKQMADTYRKLMKDIGERAKEEGVLKGLAEHYVTYIVDKNKVSKGVVQDFLSRLFDKQFNDGRMAPESRFGKEHHYESFEALQAAIKDSGLSLRTKDLAEIYKSYATSMERAIENKKLMDSLKLVRDLRGEKQVREVTKEEPIRYDEEVIPSAQFAGMVVNKDLSPALKFAFEAKDMNDFYKAAYTLSQAIKRINVVASFFHAKTLMEVMSSAGIPIVTPLKEVSLAIADKMLGTKMSGLTKAVDMYRKGGMGDSVDQWLRSGLIARPPEDVTIGALHMLGGIGDKLISKYAPETHILERNLARVEKITLDLPNKITWDFLHTGGKIMVAEKYLEKQRIAAHESGKPFDEKTARQEISKFLNSAFGGLDWFQLAKDSSTEMGKRIAMSTFSPEGRRALQVALFAPDWTVSTLDAFKSALPKGLNPLNWHPKEAIRGMRTPTTKTDYARLYQLKTALTYFTLLNGINMMTANRPIWENKDPTRIEFPDGTSIQGMKHALEPYHWLTAPWKTLGAKLGFIPRAAVIATTGLEYVSPDAQKLVDPSALGRTKAIAEMALPFQVQAASQAPPGEGVKRAVMGTLGFPELGSNAEQKLEARRARTKALRDAAKKYHKEAKEKGWE